MLKDKMTIYDTSDLKLQTKLNKFIDAISKVEGDFGLSIEPNSVENIEQDYDGNYFHWTPDSELIIVDEDGNILATLINE